ncbi:two-partner secretion domain-containing protein [Pseudomonas sp. SDO528_S397]
MDVRQFAFLARQPSAALKTRGNFLGLPKRGLALILVNALFWQPLLAQADGIVVNAPGTTLAQAGNGVPIVNIAAPNAAGLSHNQFHDYNVGAQGLILNNATDRTQSTQLGGIIVGNPNFNGRAASTVLNEVNGGSPSQLRGYTEVAGQSAHVIVANPYGISCNGCGFINTPQVTLTTGKAVIENGQVSRYQVDQGAVSIDGDGLNASNVGQFEIITRAAQINAQIQAQKLTVVTGRNDVDAATLNATARTADGSPAPTVAIDSSALGGMYAGTIRLVGTEAGVGVKLAGNLVAGGDIQIDAAGHVNLAQTSAGTAINIKADSLDTAGAVYAGSDLTVKTQGALNNGQTLAARDSITLASGARLTNSGIIEAGVNADNSRNANGDVRLSAQALDNTGKSVIASRDLSVQAAALVNQGGTLNAADSLALQVDAGLDNRNGKVLARTASVQVGTLDNRLGQLQGDTALTLTSLGAVDNRQGTLATGQTLSLSAGSLDNSNGRLTSNGGLTANIAGQMLNQTGLFAANGALTLATGALNNAGGRLTSADRLDLSAGAVDNSAGGRIASAQALTASVTGLDQHAGGQLYSSASLALDLHHGQLNNTDGLINTPGSLLLDNLNEVANSGGEISSAQAFTLAAHTLDNSDGKVLSEQALTLKLDQALTNLKGQILAAGLKVQAASLDNSGGLIGSSGDLTVNVDGALANEGGEVSSAGATLVSAAALNNHIGQVLGDISLDLTSRGALLNQGGTLGAGQRLQVQAASLDNSQSGSLVSDGSLDATVTGLLDNHAQGSVAAKGAVALHAANLDNRNGAVRGNQNVDVQVGQVDNRQGVINSKQALTLVGQSLNNQNGLASATGPLHLTQGSVSNDQGRLASQADLDATIGVLTQQGGELVAQGNLTLKGGSLDNHNGGLVSATKALTLAVDSSDNRAGEISSQQGVTFTGGQLDNSGGKLLAATALELAVAQVINQAKGLVFAQDVHLSGARLDNAHGTVAGQHSLALELSPGATALLDGRLDNTGGTLSSEGGLTLLAQRIDNTGGAITSAGALAVTSATDLLNLGGTFDTAHDLTLSSASLDNSQQGVIKNQGAATLATGVFNNLAGGQLTSAGKLGLTATQVNNGGRIASSDVLTASVTGLNQQGGELFSSLQVNLDLNHGDLNNAGLINAPVLTLANLGNVGNQNGEISSQNAFVLAARNLDNSHGKLISNAGLTLTVEQVLSNVAGHINAQGLMARSARLDNTDGVISSHAGLDIGASDDIVNQRGSLIGDGSLLLTGTRLDNRSGEVAGKTDMAVAVGAINNQQGQLVSTDTLHLSGASLDNRNGLVGATNALTLEAGAVDNRSGELTGNAGVNVSGQYLDNSDSGKVFAAGLLTLRVDQLLNRTLGQLNGQQVLVTGTSLDNRGGKVVSQQPLVLALSGDLDNTQGLLSSESGLDLNAANLNNTQGSLSSAQDLTVGVNGQVNNLGGQLVSDGALTLHSTSLGNQQGSLSAKGAVALTTAHLANQGGRINSGDSLNLVATQLDNGGSIGSARGLTASVTGLDQQGGKLFSNDALTLDVNNGLLDNGGGLINAAGPLRLKNLSTVSNQSGEISSGQAFTLAAQSLDNSNGKVLSNQALTLRVDQVLNNFKGLIGAASLDARAATVDNRGGSFTSRGDLQLTSAGLLNNAGLGLISAAQALTVHSADLNNQGGSLLGTAAVTLNAMALDNSANGLINSQGNLALSVASLNTGNGGEVSAKGTLDLSTGALVSASGRLVGEQRVTLDLNNGDLDNHNGSILAKGPLTLNHLRDLNNRGGELSSQQDLQLAARTLDNSAGTLISSQALTVGATDLINQNGLLSGWQGVSVSGASLDNRNNGTLSSRNGAVGVNLSGALLNSGAGALVSQGRLDVNVASLDNTAGILSSGAGQGLSVGGLLNNSGGGLIDSGAALDVQAATLGNDAGTVNAQQALTLKATDLNNNAGTLAGKDAVTLNLLGNLNNTGGTLASAGPLVLQHAVQVNNQGGQIASQSLLTLFASSLDNSQHGTLAGVGPVAISALGLVQNNADGLIYSQGGSLRLSAASLANSRGVVQGQNGLALDLRADVDNQSGKLIAQTGDVTLNAASLDNRGGTLASLAGALRAQVVGVLRNGYDLNNNRQGGTVQGQSLNVQAAMIDNDGGRVSAAGGDAWVTTGDFDNRNGGLYAQGLMHVSGNNFDNSGDNDGQISGQQIDLSLSGALNNRLGIIESQSTLNVSAASLDNQAGRLRALGTAGKTAFAITGLLDNTTGVLETANSDLTLGAGSLLNAGGSVLHVGNGNFTIAPGNLNSVGGSLVTRGALSINQDTWTNNSVIQAGRLNVNVNTLDQTGAGQLLASNGFVGTGGNWSTNGLIASDGSLDLHLGGALNGSGRISSAGDLSLGAAQLSLSNTASVAGGGLTTLNIAGVLNNAGRLTSANDLVLNAGTVNNYATLGAGQALTATTGVLLNDHGLIFSGADMRLRVDSLTNSYADIYSLGNLSVDRDGQGGLASRVINSSSSLQSDGNLSLAASTLQNVRAVLTTSSGGIYTASISEFPCQEGPNYAGDCDGKKINHLWQVVQRDRLEVTAASAASSITAGQNLTLTGGDVLNASSTVGAAGSLSIVANNLTNSGVEAGETETWRLFVSMRSRDASSWYEQAAAFDDRYSIGGAAYNPNDLSGLQAAMAAFIGTTEAERTVLRRVTQISGGDQSYAGVIQAGGAVNVKAQGSIDNTVVRPGFTYVGAGAKTGTGSTGASGAATYSTRMTVNSQLPPNLAQLQVNPLTLPGFSLPTGQNGLFRLSGQGSSTASSAANTPSPTWTLGAASLGLAQHQHAQPSDPARVIQVDSVAQDAASNHPLAVAARQANALDTRASAFDVGSVSDNSASHAPGRSAAGGVGQAPNLPGLTPLSHDTGTSQTLAHVQGLPNAQPVSQPQKYLVETNPALTDLKQFMSSDYLLSGLGYNPDDSAKRLGDGLYEQRLIEQAVVARTGQRFIDGQNTDSGLFKYLMDNAISSKQQLDLTVGVSLTSAQVAALTHDIVWLEEEVVNGEKVLVPVVYLAQASNRLAPDGALIAGSDVNLIAGQDLDNVGTLRATNNLSAQAGNDLTNSGLIDAGNRLDLLAGNTIVNKAGGIIAGRDVTLTATKGDILNERTVTSHDSSSGYRTEHTDSVDSAARIIAANTLSLQAGRDVNNVGGVMSSGADTTISAGRDVNLVSAQGVNANAVSGLFNGSSVTQYGSSVDAGRDLNVQAGRDINAVASQLDAKRDVTMAALGDVSLSSAADESHASFTSKKVKSEDDHVSQVSTTVKAGGDVALSAGHDLALTASRVTAGDEAYLYAGNNLGLLAAEDSDYSLYDMKKKGSLGAKKTQRDETTQVTHVGSEITTGGNLTLQSGSDQVYQVAKLSSGADLTIATGGGVDFQGVKDLHQESHDKSSSSLAWNSAKGKGNTDETLRQSELIAQGSLAIKAVEGLKIDVKSIDQQSVSQTIDVMVKADPQLAWLKDAEKRGDIDWKQVKETHDSYKYSTSSLGAGAMLAIIIVVSALTAGAASGAIGTMAGTGAEAGSGAAFAAGGSSAMVSAGTAVGTASAGWANAALSASLGSLAGTGAVSFVNNKGNLGAALGDTFGSNSLKNALVGGFTAGALSYADSTFLKPPTGASDGGSAIYTANAAQNPGYTEPMLTWKNAADTVLRSGAHAVISSGISTAINGGSIGTNLGSALVSESIDLAAAAGNRGVGDLAKELKVDPGTATTMLLHATLGGLISVAKGHDFASGAIAGGAAEGLTPLANGLLAQYASDQFSTDDLSDEGGQKKVLTAQLIGLLSSSLAGGDAATGSMIGGYGEKYNQDLHVLMKAADVGFHKIFAAMTQQPADDFDSSLDSALQSGQPSGVFSNNVFVGAEYKALAGLLMAAASTEVLAGRAVAGEAAEISASLGRVFNEVGNEAAGGARAAASEAGGGGSGGSVIEEEVAGGGDAGVEGAKATDGTTSSGAENALNAGKRRAQLTADEIADGHAFEKHVIQQGEYQDLGITTREEFSNHIEEIVNNPTSFRELSGGRSAYWDDASGTVVIRNPKAADGGTAFRPTSGRTYFDNLR